MRKYHFDNFAWLIVIFAVIIASILYSDSFKYYFFQDDWFSLTISRADSAQEFLKLFIPRSDVIYWRPLGMQIPFFIISKALGISSQAFHLLTFVTHALNSILLFLLARSLIKSNISGALASFFYATSTVHYIPFYWAATFSFVLGPTFFFISFIAFIQYLKIDKTVWLGISLFSFILGMMTNEMLIITPPIFFIYCRFVLRKTRVKQLLPYAAVALMIILIRFILFPPPLSGNYSLGIGENLISNIRGYLLWSFQWPEEMKNQFINSVTINPRFLKDFPWYFYVYTVSFIIIAVLGLFLPIVRITFFLKKSGKSVFKLAVFCILWYFIGLFPVLFFSNHSYAYYLPISLAALVILIGRFLETGSEALTKKKLLIPLYLGVVAVAWLFVGVQTIEFNRKIHWASRRAILSRNLVIKAEKYMAENHTANVLYIWQSSENQLALNNQDAMRIIFNDPLFSTVYTKDSLRYKIIR